MTIESRRGVSATAPIFRVATCGKVTDTGNFGGAPYFLCEALAHAGFSVAPHDLKKTRDFRWRRVQWSAGEVAAGRGFRGFMFSDSFLEAAWCAAPTVGPGDWIINLHQVLPESVIERAERGEVNLVPYVDLCLHELIHEWSPASGHTGPSEAHYRKAFALERRGYLAARRIVTFSCRTAEVLRTIYDIDPRRIVTVTPGANLDEDRVEAVLVERPPETDTFVVGYVGIDHQRKGLAKLAAAVLAARQMGAPVSLRVIGPPPSEFADTPGIEVVGFVKKFGEMTRFIELLSSCQLGCLLSLAEGLPISLLEFLRLGVPIMGTEVNGIPDIVKPDTGVLVDPSASANEIATILARLAACDAEYRRLRDRAWQSRRQSSWRRTVADLRAAVPF